MEQAKLYGSIHTKLESFIDKYFFDDELKQAAMHSLFPAGKLFRPMISANIFLDEDKAFDENLYLLMAALEIHHTYTLIHDDLPCMDDDDMRRGRKSLHKEFNEWTAVLTGDGLLNLSYQLIGKIKHPTLSQIIQIFAKSMGVKGLIRGQYLDLSEQMSESLDKLLETHRLKTARLIQCSITLSYLLSKQNPDMKQAKDMWRYGEDLGLIFQLLDDLSELVEQEVSEHERKINPWISNYRTCEKLLLSVYQDKHKLEERHSLRNTSEFFQLYLEKMKSTIRSGGNQVAKHLDLELAPIVSLLNRLD